MPGPFIRALSFNAVDALSLHCPNCGAAVAQEAPNCPHCQARLATMSCPSCFALMFRGAAFCPHCGARADRREDEAATATCPGCRGEMHAVTLGKTTLLDCTACDGVWVDTKQFETLREDRESHAAVLARFHPPAVTAEPAIHYRPCLRCGKMMNRVNFGLLSGAVVDVCSQHGTFLDSGELHRIVTFIDSGGLDRARKKQLDTLRDEERKLAVARTQGVALELPASNAGWGAGSSLLDFIQWIVEQLGKSVR